VTPLRLRTGPARLFPFIRGLARARRLACRWLWYGAEHAPLPEHDGRYVARLDPASLAGLGREVRAFAPTHVLVNERVDAACLDALGAGAAAPEVRSFAADAPPTDDIPQAVDAPDGRSWSRVEWLRGWLGDAITRGLAGEAFLADVAPPAYDAVTGNAAARRLQPPIVVLGGHSCLYRRPIGGNPRYRGVDLTEARRDYGCAFCTSPNDMVDAAGDPIELAGRQLAALRRTAPPGGRACGELEFQGIETFLRLGELTDLVLAAALPPSRLGFHPRIDEVLAVAPALRRVLPRLRAAGHRLFLHRMGIENLAPAENERFNKGLDAGRVAEAVRLIRQLKTAFPGTFDAVETYGYILFTPWTTLDDAGRSIREGVGLGLPPDGSWLWSVLELSEDMAITHLAACDGIELGDRFDDPALRLGLVFEGTFRPGLRAWRFRDRRVALLFGLVARAGAAGLRQPRFAAFFGADPLYAAVCAARDRRGALPPVATLALELIALLRESPTAPEPAPLLAAALARLPGAPGRPRGG
jgi:hypothetical protein